jgi:hypothetical protein
MGAHNPSGRRMLARRGAPAPPPLVASFGPGNVTQGGERVHRQALRRLGDQPEHLLPGQGHPTFRCIRGNIVEFMHGGPQAPWPDTQEGEPIDIGSPS